MDVYFDILPIFDYSVIDRKNLKKIYFVFDNPFNSSTHTDAHAQPDIHAIY